MTRLQNLHVGLVLKCTLALLLATAQSASAADKPKAMQTADTSSPRATLESFIDSCNRLHSVIQSDQFFDRTSYEHRPLATRIIDCLDISELPEYEQLEAAGEAALYIKEILDRVEIPPWEEIPDTEAIAAAGESEAFARWKIPGTRLTIERIEEGPQKHEYLFSAGTVSRAKTYFQDMQALPYRTDGPETSQGFYRWYVSAPGHPAVAPIVKLLPDWTRERPLGVSNWKLIGLAIIVPLAVLLMGACYKLQMNLGRKSRGKSNWRYCLTIVFPILAMLVPLLFIHVMTDLLTLRGQWYYVFSFLANMVALLSSFVVVFALSNRIAATIIASPRIHPQGLDAQFIRILSKLLSIVAVMIIFLEGGNYLGIPVTTLIASAGVGGLAIALAAQDMLKNLFGTVMLLTDKPFRVGERIIFDKYDGVVKDIGLRSTRIRLLNGHEAAIPNDELARNDIENVGRRPHIRRIADIHIPLDTTQDKLQKAVEIVRAALQDHEGMEPDFPPRVFFLEFTKGAFVIRAMYWYHPANYWDYLAFSEKFNFQIFEEFTSEGIQFSLPMRVTHTSKESQAAPLEISMREGQGREGAKDHGE